jgi:cytochrome c oxidase subunit 2
MFQGITGHRATGKLATMALFAVAGLMFFAGPAAAERVGAASPWQMGFQEAATPIMEQVTQFHNLLLVIITGITIFVLVLMLYIAWRFSERRNPEPSKTTHNTLLEVVWTVVPVLILVVIAIPSFRLMYYQAEVANADMTIKATGRQWYWTYEYPDHGGFTFDSFMIADDEINPEEGQLRQLSVDEAIVLPVGRNIRIQITASDVLHSFAMPSFGIKTDAIPGRLNETWARIDEPGIYYGQCSELCGVGHAEMPIVVRAVSEEDFQDWIETQQAQHGIEPAGDRQIAQTRASE